MVILSIFDDKDNCSVEAVKFLEDIEKTWVGRKLRGRMVFNVIFGIDVWNKISGLLQEKYILTNIAVEVTSYDYYNLENVTRCFIVCDCKPLSGCRIQFLYFFVQYVKHSSIYSRLSSGRGTIGWTPTQGVRRSGTQPH